VEAREDNLRLFLVLLMCGTLDYAGQPNFFAKLVTVFQS